MAQTESIPAPARPAARPLPLESFLATDDPVWVWDGQGRRIVWANAAAGNLWGDASPDRLKRRRTGQSGAAPGRLTALARSVAPLDEHVETLQVPAPGGPVAVACVFQRLRLAGGRPGLVVRALPDRSESEASAEIAWHPAVAESGKAAPHEGASGSGAPARKHRKTASRSDLGALKAIARDLGDATSRPPAKSARSDSGKRANGNPSEKRQARQKAGERGAPAGKGAKKRKTPANKPPAKPDSPSGEEMAALLARVSHEIRNPLTIILGFAEILKSDRVERLPPGKAREYADDIYRTAQLALGLADDLLGFAERAGGEPPPPHEWVDLNALIADCLHLLEPAASAQGVALTRLLKRGAPLLLANERSMRQIMLNLLMNALRHGDGGGKIRVMTRLEKDGALILSVKDDGPGMSEDQIAAANAPDRTRDIKKAGRRGLGLRLVAGFVRDNEGELDIRSKPGEGTDVRIRFAPERLQMPQPKKTAKPKKPGKTDKKNKAKQPPRPKRGR